MSETEGWELPPTVGGSGDGDLVGRILGGRYRILRKLGEGAMGAVYLGEHLKIGRQDAIKVLRDQLAGDPDTIARFVRGTRNVSMIRHPNICTIYDYSDTGDGVQFVAMEFVAGETLRDMLRREGRVSVETAIWIARQAAEALDAAHEVGIVHRDLKPANIMVTRGRGGMIEVKVVDFDIAKGSSDGEGEEVTRMGFVVGTPEYMSPEQLIGERLDGRSDIYSLALVLFRMLTGVLPFAASDTQDLMIKRLTEEPMTLGQALPGVDFPPMLEAAMRRALRRKADERQATAGEFARELAAVVAMPGTVVVPQGTAAKPAPPVEAARPTAPQQPPSPARPSALPWVAGGTVATAAVAAAALLAFNRDAPSGTLPDLAGSTPVDSAVSTDSPVDTLQQEVVAESIQEEPAPQSYTPSYTAPPPRRDPVESADPRAPSEDRLIDILTAVIEPGTARSMLMSLRNEATRAWNDRTLPANHRASGAYVTGEALVALGDTTAAITWFERAVELRPGYAAYEDILRTYRSLRY